MSLGSKKKVAVKHFLGGCAKFSLYKPAWGFFVCIRSI